MAYKIIRCGECYNLVIAVTPPDAGPDTPGAKFYRYATWEIDGAVDQFHEITDRAALMYFSGQADGLGWQPDCPTRSFKSLADIEALIFAERCKTGQEDAITHVQKLLARRRQIESEIHALQEEDAGLARKLEARTRHNKRHQ